MESSEFSLVADRIYGCECTTCPLHPRVGRPGFFPKFGAGGTSEPLLGLVTMNPGPPDSEQQAFTRQTLSRTRMHHSYDQGLRRYHLEPRGGALDLPAMIGVRTGIAWSQVYYTELAKCVTTKAEARDGTRKAALSVCSNEFLASELSALPSFRALLCLGGAAFETVLEIVRASPALARLMEGDRILRVSAT